jgi:poly(3-hydroxybutyrate) depolymerase
MYRNLKYLSLFLLCIWITGLYASQSEGSVLLTEGLVLELPPGTEGSVISPDVIAALVETGSFRSPAADEQVLKNGNVMGTWRRLNADGEGWFRGAALRNAYVYLRHVSEHDRIVLLQANGHEMAYVNGIPRSGNPYSNKDIYEDWETRFDYSLIPIQLHEGTNEFLFRCNRRSLKVILQEIESGLHFNTKDVTLPDIRVNHPADTYGAIPVINASERTYGGLFIKTWTNKSSPEYHPVRKINPFAIQKVPFRIKHPPVADGQTAVTVHIELIEKTGTVETVLAVTEVVINVVPERSPYKATFISALDGSVQYFGVNPPVDSHPRPALFLSLHGAGVEAINQAKSYSSKNWGYIVAPTNRRPYGYNWENWGRLDALEVLAIAEKKFNIDNDRVYLTGHSMGGHGTWHLGINYPDKFASLGPSAGWISIWGYRIRPQAFSTDIGKMLIRSAKQSDTYAIARNLQQTGVYVIHGSDDDNVPAEQSRSMIDTLSHFHTDYIYHEEPGAGHWWDYPDSDGADCIDWMPMFDYFARRSVPGSERIRMIEFVTANPAVSAKNNWIEIIRQIKQQSLSRIDINVETSRRMFTGYTENIEMLAVDATMLHGDEPVTVSIDGQTLKDISLPANKKIYLLRENDVWMVSERYGEAQKNPRRTGNIREVLNHDVVFVYGTHGSEEERAWAYAKARYDAEVIWYQGNGAIEVIPDSDFDAKKYEHRNVMLFGNAHTNSAWKSLLSDSPVQVGKEKITVGGKDYTGDDLSCLMIRPRSDSDVASVGVVSGTGLRGMKQANFAPYHHPYVGLPDIVIYNSDILLSDNDGIRFIGYFGKDWSIQTGEFIQR